MRIVLADENGTTTWRDENGKLLHRDDGGLPAFEWANGHKEWWVHGRFHRDGGLPAVEHADGGKEWWVHGASHRDGGLAAFVLASGRNGWNVHGHTCSERQSQLWAVRQQCLRLCVFLHCVTTEQQMASVSMDNIATVVLGPCLVRNLRVHWSIQ